MKILHLKIAVQLLALALVSPSCGLTPDYIVPNLICETGSQKIDESGYWEFIFDDTSLNKALTDSNKDLNIQVLGDTTTGLIVVWQSASPGTNLGYGDYGDDLTIKAYPRNAIKAEWNVPANEPWPTDCLGPDTSPTETTAPLNTIAESNPDEAYKQTTTTIQKKVVGALVTLQSLFASADPNDQDWVLSVAGELLTFRDAYAEAQALNPPASFTDANKILMNALSVLNDVSYSLPEAIDRGNLNRVRKEADKMWGTLESLDRFRQLTR